MAPTNEQLHVSIRTPKQVGLSDAVLLKPDPTTDYVSEESFLDNLEARFRSETIYTYIGDVVVSVNPFKPLQGLYSQAAVEMYRGKYYYEVSPHIYSIADDAHRYNYRSISSFSLSYAKIIIKLKLGTCLNTVVISALLYQAKVGRVKQRPVNTSCSISRLFLIQVKKLTG
jgi:hypothetical protein